MKKAHKNTIKRIAIGMVLTFVPLLLSIYINNWFMLFWVISLGIGVGKLLKR